MATAAALKERKVKLKKWILVVPVGMSVYKDEATRGVPMENIYIPLTAIAESADENDAEQPRTDPLELLARESRHVVLGDPGSGKSTLLRFLGLVGISEPLRKRCGTDPDDRLAVLVILRRYADDLKERRNLPLIDHIIETVQADFSLKSADLEFFEYALETGQAILLFDGLDELPSPQFKKMVADRIRGLTTTYPGNTTIVTSRIVGYEAPSRFDDKQFRHLKLARLRLPEIERFIHDWYAVRIENKRNRKANADDRRSTTGRRVVLYQKCTETLLNTWQNGSIERQSDTKEKGSVETEAE